MGVESVSVAETLSHADTLEVSGNFLIGVQLPALEYMEGKKHTSYRNYSTKVYKQNLVQHLNYSERLHQLK